MSKVYVQSNAVNQVNVVVKTASTVISSKEPQTFTRIQEMELSRDRMVSDFYGLVIDLPPSGKRGVVFFLNGKDVAINAS